MSDSINYTTTEIGNSSQPVFFIFPNPSNDFIDVNFTAKNSEEITVQVMNTIGQIIFETKNTVRAGDGVSEKISLKEFESGIYFLSIQSSSFKHIEKIRK